MRKIILSCVALVAIILLYGSELNVNGVKRYYTADYSDTQEITSSPVCFKKGESVVTDESFDLNGFVKSRNLKLLFTEIAGDVTIYYYSYPFAEYFRYVNGYAVNMQIAVAQKRVTIGVPVIYGSF